MVYGELCLLLWRILLKFKKTRAYLEGKPSIIIRDGKIDRKELKKNRMNLNQLLSLLRQSETFSIREVAYAILETNGSISILKKNLFQKVTLEDLNIAPAPTYLCTSLILDGEIVEDNLSELGFDKTWLDQQLQAQGVSSVKDVLYADWIKDGGMYIIPFQKTGS